MQDLLTDYDTMDTFRQWCMQHLWAVLTLVFYLGWVAGSVYPNHMIEGNPYVRAGRAMLDRNVFYRREAQELSWLTSWVSSVGMQGFTNGQITLPNLSTILALTPR